MSFEFAVKIVKLSKLLQSETNGYIMSKQIMRSGTAVGACVHEAEFAQSRADFISKLSIALKEANETKYWMNLLQATEFITKEQHDSLTEDITRIIGLLAKSIKTAKTNEQ